MTNKQRVVVTGLGAVTPLGCGAEPSWSRLLQGESGISYISHFDTHQFPIKIAGEVPSQGSDPFILSDWVPLKDHKKFDRFIFLGAAAAAQALEDARWSPRPGQEQESTGVLIGSGIGGLPRISETMEALINKGPRGVSPFFIPASLINLASGYVSVKFGLRGPNVSIVTACASGAHAIGESYRIIQRGDAKVMVAGGAEAAICPLGVAGFASMKALSTQFEATPEKASRPWDKDRDGFVIGEGAGIVVLESLEHALERGARIYGEVVGYGLSSDAYHVTAPDAEAQGSMRAMRSAIQSAGISPKAIQYINAHATSTPLGDRGELKAIQEVFADHPVAVSSTKSSIGHLLGASGSVEAIFCLLALRDQKVPGTLNLENCSEETGLLDLVPLASKPLACQYVLSNSFGFGSTNASLVFTQFKP